LKPGGQFILTTENYFNGLILAWLQSWIFGVPFNSGAGVQPRETFFVFGTSNSSWRETTWLLRERAQVHHLIGHRWFPWSQAGVSNPTLTPEIADPRKAARSRPYFDQLHHHPGHDPSRADRWIAYIV